MKFTVSQNKAINTFGANLTVSAGAGSGKTTVLVNKYIQLIAGKAARLDQILAITFTNKAARDMRKKVRSYINRNSSGSPDLDQAYWQRIKSQFDSANITTIHSFALQALQSHPLAAAIHPSATLLDEIQALLVLQDVVASQLTARKNFGLNFRKLIVDLGSSDALIAALIKVYQKARSLGGEPAEIAKLPLQYESEAQDQLENIKQKLITSLTAMQQQAQASMSKSRFIKIWQQADVDSLQQAVSEAETLNDYDLMATIREIRRKCSRPVQELAELARAISCKTESSGYLYQLEAVLAYFDALPTWKAVQKMIVNIHHDYSQLKQEMRALDYSDLEWKFLKLLSDNPQVQKKYQAKFKYVMVDEFQDTSPLQQQIVRYIAPYRQNKLFIVGDARQSIYRFRAAEVEGFIDMNRQIKQYGGEKIELQENFRSNPQLIDFYNKFFSTVFSDTPIEYEQVVAGRNSKDHGPQVELWVPEKKAADQLKSRNRHELEAKIIADKIIELTNETGVEPADIAVLFRSLTDVKIYERQLQKQSIPYVVAGSRGFFVKQEILDMLNLLTYFVHDQSKIALCGLLRSPLFGLSDEALFHLERKQKLVSLTDCASLSEADKLAWQKAVTFIREWRNLLLVKPVSFVLQRVVDDTNLNPVLLGSPGYGLQAVANVEKLLNTVMRLEQNGLDGKVDILRYLMALKDSDAQYGEAIINAAGNNAVQIMTIHQAKGLEFNTVIIAQCARALSYPNSEILQYTKDFGLVVRCRGWQDKPQKNSYYQLMNEAEKIKDRQESYRLLYVAATRAAEKLVFSAVPDKWPGATADNWLGLIANFLVMPEWPETAVSKDLVEVVLPEIKGYRFVQSADSPGESSSNESPLVAEVPTENCLQPILSVSALIDYSTCPSMFYYKNLQKLPPIIDLFAENNQVDPAVLGSLLHKVCEKANSQSDIEKYWKITLRDSDLPPALLPDYQTQGQQILAGYANSSLLTEVERAQQIQSEVPFMFKYRELTLSGIIDKIIINGQKIKIIDFKSGRISLLAIEKYRLQIALYALAIARQYQRFPASLTIFFMESGKEHEYVNELSSVEKCYAVIDEVVNSLQHSLNTNQFSKGECNYRQCSYQLLCKKNN